MDLMQEFGMPPLFAARAVEQDADRLVGSIVADTIRVQPFPLPPSYTPLCVHNLQTFHRLTQFVALSCSCICHVLS